MEGVLISKWFAKCMAWLLAATLAFAMLLTVVVSYASGAGGWATPASMALQKVSTTTSAQAEPNLFSNLDCTPLSYRLVDTAEMKSGCFSDSTFGLIDTDSDVVIFNGADEGIRLLPHGPGQVLLPWAHSGTIIALTSQATDGDHITLYKHPLSAMADKYDYLSHLAAKQLSQGPDMTLKWPSGTPLTVNAQTIAFSDEGAWMVVETLNGSFVRISLADFSVTAFAPAFGAQGGPALLKSRVSITDDGRYIALSNEADATFKVYDLSTCDGIVTGTQPQRCGYYDYRPYISQHIAGLERIGHVRFINDDLLSFDAFSSEATGKYELAPDGQIHSLTNYIGLGDSYTSGEGAFDYLEGTDTAQNMCHLSARSYPLLLAHDAFGDAGSHSVACSGAVIRDIGSTSLQYRGQAGGIAPLGQLQQSQPLLLESVEANFLPGYVAQHRFVKRWQPRVVTVSVGGDDIGFGDILKKCVAPHISKRSENTCYNTYEDRLELLQLIDRTVPRWAALYRQLAHEAPQTQLYAIGYPQIADSAGKCALNVQLNEEELAFSGELITYLDESIRKAAGLAGVQYIDISQALSGHRLCEAEGHDVAMNGLTAGNDAGVSGIKFLGKESYHPNALGQSLIEQAILKQTRGFTDTDRPVVRADNPDATTLLQVPATRRTTYTLSPSTQLTGALLPRGIAQPIQAEGANYGLRPVTAYSIRVDVPSGQNIGTVSSDANGDLSGHYVLPQEITPGFHSVDVIGTNQIGTYVDLTQLVYVQATADDSDGDGIEDVLDTCPLAINSGQDMDRDGVDDICDNFIDASRLSGSHPDGPSPHTGDSNTTARSPSSHKSPSEVLSASTRRTDVPRTHARSVRYSLAASHSHRRLSFSGGAAIAVFLIGACVWFAGAYTKKR